MAELNQMIDKRNEEFAGDARKLAFWYDDNGDFAEDMDKVNSGEVGRNTDSNR